ncbi:MAG: VOC family protein [Lachnospiraceae bacterium]|nr:VOC family protein [Lachnospiraceae bacterium]
MKIIGVDHFTINVFSMEKSIQFYEEIMQLEKEEQVDMGDHIIQYFKIDVSNTLELIKYNYKTDRIAGKADNQGIYRHLAICVDNIEDAFLQIEKSPDVKMLMSPADCPKLKFKNFLFRDPNGVEIEIVERY